MFVEAGGWKRGTLLGSLLVRCRSALARRKEMQGLDAREMAAIAYELNLSEAELATLTFRPSGSLESLSKRLSHAGLSEQDLAASYGDELRGLRRVCGQCRFKSRCARDLNHERRATPAIDVDQTARVAPVFFWLRSNPEGRMPPPAQNR